ncbi:MAG: hypothetical protein ABGZ35_17015, partial [Planctomycetaceae bacterium]
MSGLVNIVVTCTKQKTREPSERLQLRHLLGSSVQQRARKWAGTLQKSRDQVIPARQLYAGDHWAVARDLPELSTPKRQINVWIASAGYGLISIDEPLCPYSATFSNPHPDSVIMEGFAEGNGEQKAAWWNAMIGCDWSRERPHSIAELAAEMPDD